MNIKQNFIDWLQKQPTYNQLTIQSKIKFIEKMVEFFGFDPFEIEDDLSNIEIVKNRIIEKLDDLQKNTDYKEFQQKSSNGAPAAFMGRKNYFVFLDELKANNQNKKLDLSDILNQPIIKSIIDEPDFYFQKGQDALKRWLNLQVSEELKVELQNLSHDYKKFQEEASSRSDLRQILELLFEIITYCDIHARGKNIYNKYDDKRALAEAGVRMYIWIEKLIQYKFSPYLVEAGSVKNAFDYLLNPSNNTSILSENHRQLISENLLKKPYNPAVFVDDLKAFFDEYNLITTNSQNYTHLLMWIVYSLQDKWKDEVVGLMASDGTGWQDELIQQFDEYDAAVVWNSKRPSGTTETIKFLRAKIAEGEEFPLYYNVRGQVKYKATIIDFAENQEELSQKAWKNNYKLLWYNDDFSKYRDDNKSASIVFLVGEMKEIGPISPNNFEFYKNFQLPTQDNLAPIKKEPININQSLNTQNFKQIIELIKLAVEADDETKGLFSFRKTKDSHVWIKDSQNIIGDRICHYEILFHEKERSLTVDVHFEGSAEEQKKFETFGAIVPPEIKTIKWQKVPSLRYGRGISIDDPNLVDEVKNQLLFIENNIGNKLRQHIKSITNNVKNATMKINQPLNQILFGPPGTGKTYNTINKAIAIANPDFDLTRPRKEIKEEFEKLMKDGQVVFTTFHQSMSYEDFIEGIKPIKPEADDSFVKYDVIPGIFKKLCRKADAPSNLTFDIAYQKLLKDLEEKGEVELKTVKESFKILVSDSGDDLSVKSDSYIKNITKDGLAYVSKSNRYAGTWGQYYKAIFQFLKDEYDYRESEQSEIKNHVLIIDEINRGNVSQIFGELITLIEEDKRIEKDEALEVTLPYSKEKFGVPSNLYIIGTMNTADRSVEALDTALRRRFSFEEVPPRYDLSEIKYEIAGYKGSEILKTLNKRIEKLLDKDHQIGHSYFMKKAGENVEEKLINSFYKNIIPLLQEYFFGDFGKIGLVLGKGFVEKIEWNVNTESFAEFDHESANEFDDRPIYNIIDYRKLPEVERIGQFSEAINKLMNKKN